jgi:hypothetical protein
LQLIQLLVCYLLISDVGADHLLVPPDGLDEAPPRPEFVTQLAFHILRNANRALPFQILDHLRHRIFRRDWLDCQADRDRDAIYAYLTAVYGLVSWWTAEGREVDRARRALRLQRLEVSEREDAFAAIIRCSADPAKADKRTRSKWSRALRYAAAYKPDSEPLDRFVRRKGGINACAAWFGRFLGRGRATRSERRLARG